MGKNHDHGHPHSHDHDHGHSHFHSHVQHYAGNQRALTRALGVAIAFMLIEAIGGWFANSLALLSDAVHMLTDVGAMLLSIFVLWMARRPVTATMSFGYHRAEILGALASGLIIWLLAGFLIFESILRLAAPPEVQGPIVFVVATIGLASNLLSMHVLSEAKKNNLNVRAAYVHVLSDALGSIGAIIAGVVLWTTHWWPIDPIMTIVISLLMLYNSWGLVRESVSILMESTPTGVDSDQVRETLRGVPGVVEVHDLHIWTVSSGRLALSVHLISDDYEKVLTLAHEVLKLKHSIVHTTIQVEHPARFQSERCYDCN